MRVFPVTDPDDGSTLSMRRSNTAAAQTRSKNTAAQQVRNDDILQ